MGDLSAHFNHRDFACRCPECKGEYRIHLGLVGALELIGSHFRKKVRLISAYWCDSYHEKMNKPRRSLHSKGKAAHIAIDGISPQEIFKFAETVPELRGIGFYPKEKWIHIDTRSNDPARFVKEGSDYLPLTSDRRSRYGLQ